jgi:hypothetical protein
MNPDLKTYLDVAKEAYGDKARSSAEAIRQTMYLAGGDAGELVAALRYLVQQRAHSDPIATLLEAVLKANGLEKLINSVTGPEDFLKFLHYDSMREVFELRLKNTSVITKWAKAIIASDLKLDFEQIVFVCNAGRAEGQILLRPDRISDSEIIELLEWLKLTPNKFFPKIAGVVTDQAIAYKPESDARKWLSRFLDKITDYYGHSARAWISAQIEARASEPLFWQTALTNIVSDDSAQVVSIHLNPEQNSWVRRLKLDQMRKQLHYQIQDIAHFSRGSVIVQTPLLLSEYGCDFPGHEFRPIWSWLSAEASEAAIYSWFHAACQDVIEDYASPEDSITGALCAYLKSHAANYADIIKSAWQGTNPKEQMKLDVDYVDFRRGRDVAGADLVLVLSANAPGRYLRSSFIALQCKKLRGPSLKLNEREHVQKEELRTFTHASYYLLFSCEHLANRARGPIVISARTIDGLLRASTTKTINRDILMNIGRPLEEYFVADLLPGWSGDERWETPEEIQEVVDAHLRPVRIMRAAFTAVPVERG